MDESPLRASRSPVRSCRVLGRLPLSRSPRRRRPRRGLFDGGDEMTLVFVTGLPGQGMARPVAIEQSLQATRVPARYSGSPRVLHPRALRAMRRQGWGGLLLALGAKSPPLPQLSSTWPCRFAGESIAQGQAAGELPRELQGLLGVMLVQTASLDLRSLMTGGKPSRFSGVTALQCAKQGVQL